MKKYDWFTPSYFYIATDFKLGPTAKANMRNLSWGFSDGETLYINSHSYTKIPISLYSKVLYLGSHYSTFIAPRYVQVSGHSGGTPPSVGVGIGGNEVCYVLDMQTGQVYQLDDTIYAQLLAPYPGLYEKFLEEKDDLQKPDKMQYIEQLDQRKAR